MFGKFSEQMTKSAQPVAKIMEVNARMLELLSKQQTLLFTGLINDGVKFVESITGQTELNGMLAAQTVIAESMRERITGASKTTYTELTGISEEMLKAGLVTLENPQASTVSAPKETPEEKAVVKKAPAKKSAAATKSK